VIKLDWPEFKTVIDSGLQYSWVLDSNQNNVINVLDGSINYRCVISDSDTDYSDWDTNYKPASKKNLTPLDSDGALIQRTKTTKTGWHYEPRSLDFYSSKLNSLYNRKDDGAGIDDGTDYGDGVLKFYNASNTELVQGGSETDADFQIRLDAGCVKTHLDWQSTYDFDIIGGALQIKNKPTDRAYIWCIVAPDIPENLGGSVPYFAGGINLEFFTAGASMKFDGRGIKSFVYDPVNNSNKVRFIIKHKAGEQIGLQIMIDQFKA